MALDNILCLVGPNNCGKSTVLRAYELAVGNARLAESDVCLHGNGESTAVELWVHVPEGTPNIDQKWKRREGEYLLVGSRWDWRATGVAPSRSTWDPGIGDWSLDGKAAGLDEVFSSRLPKPLRVGTLESADATQGALMSMMLEPLVDKLQGLQESPDSELSKALGQLKKASDDVVAEANEDLQKVVRSVNKQYQKVFSGLSVAPKIGMDVRFNPKDALQKGSSFQVKEGGAQVTWSQQGTGSQRALFWSMLQVRSGLEAVIREKSQRAKQIADLQKEITKREKDLNTGVRETAKRKRLEKIEELRARLIELEGASATKEEPADLPSLGLPGHMLLIDEPEVGMHPNAIRAAKTYLYELARDPGWQVMLATHSPAFVDPLEDNTTIVRLERGESLLTPTVYRSASAAFSGDEKDELHVLLRFDTSLAEMFFGGYPILLEGDTEVAAFSKVMMMEDTTYPEDGRPLLVRARGKGTLELLIRLLGHFSVQFSVLHDSDSPRTKDGNRRHPAWAVNERLHSAIEGVRSAGLRVVHRVSVPDFERAHGLQASDSEKPWTMFQQVRTDETVRNSVSAVLASLLDSEAREHPFSGVFAQELENAVKEWAGSNAEGDPAFNFVVTGD